MTALLGLVGYARCGKNTLAEFLDWKQLAFADPLREFLYKLNPLVAIGDGEVTPYQDAIEHHGYDAVKTMMPSEGSACYGFSARDMLQRCGTDAGRNVLGWDIWVDAAMSRYDPAVPTVYTDVRFSNEASAIRDRGGLIVRITRDGIEPPNGHISERYVTECDADIDIRTGHDDLDTLRHHAEVIRKAHA
jgi:hypothetical protein